MRAPALHPRLRRLLGPARPPLPPGPSRGERGAALLIVIVTVAILTALAVDLAYETRVRLQIAANGRDALRAEALAKSAVNLSRLVLAFQQQIDSSAGAACNALGALQGVATGTPQPQQQQGKQATPTTPQGAGQQQQGSAGCPRPVIWQLIPVNSGLLGALFGGGEEGPARAKAPPAEEAPAGERKVATAAFGDFDGAFDAQISDEGQKINVQLDGLQTGGRIGPQVDAILRMVCDNRWDALFDRDDENGQRWSRADLPVHLREWVDGDKSSSALNVSFPGGNCSAVVPQNPFEKGFSDKNYPYDRGSDRYRVKNARLDSLDELYMVAGIGDAFMAAFGDQVTVYMPQDGGMNVNTTDPRTELLYAQMMAEPAALPALADPTFGPKLHKALMDNPMRMGGLMSITPTLFAQTLESLGVQVRTDYLTMNPKNPFTDKSITFRIRATGAAGDVTRTIDAVVTYDPRQLQDQQAAAASAVAQALQGQGQQQQPAIPGLPAGAIQGLAQAAQAASGANMSAGRLIHWQEE